jgi:hypothetical protein
MRGRWLPLVAQVPAEAVEVGRVVVRRVRVRADGPLEARLLAVFVAERGLRAISGPDEDALRVAAVLKDVDRDLLGRVVRHAVLLEAAAVLPPWAAAMPW